MQSWISPKVERRGSDVEGIGLFAKVNIPAGEIIAAKGGHVYDGVVHSRIKKELGSVALQIGESLFIGPLHESEVDPNMLRINHSCDPNVHIVGQTLFAVSRDITEGEELVFDYAMTEGEPTFSIICNCGSFNCREIVTGNDWQIIDLQERYHNHFSPYLLERIKSET